MTKKIINITTLLALIFVFFVTGCEKEKIVSNSSSDQEISKSISNANHFDNNHYYLDQMFQDIVYFFSEIEEKKYENYEIFMNDFERLIESHQRNSPYPKFDISKI